MTQAREKKGLDQDREMALTELMKQVDLETSQFQTRRQRPGWIISQDPNLPAKQPFSVSPSPQVDTRTKHRTLSQSIESRMHAGVLDKRPAASRVAWPGDKAEKTHRVSLFPLLGLSES